MRRTVKIYSACKGCGDPVETPEELCESCWARKEKTRAQEEEDREYSGMVEFRKSSLFGGF